MKKRTLTFILTTTLITGLLSACGNSSTSDSVTVPSNNSSQKSEVICLTDTVAESVNIDYSINNYNSLSDIVINIRLKTKEYSIDFNDIDLIFNRLKPMHLSMTLVIAFSRRAWMAQLILFYHRYPPILP